jgi:16S rRNA (guanine527-N7)-methyltransferase
MSATREPPPLDEAGFVARMPVSRETMERLAAYLKLLAQWQRAINLVGRSTMADPWRRHILDSAQLFRFLPQPSGRIADIGSGAGLPGIVLAIMGVPAVHLVEADRRKAQFLREVARQLGLTAVTVHAERIEALALTVNCVTARALAPLSTLLELAAPLLEQDGRLILLKGRNAEVELAEARHRWTMRVSVETSEADAHGRILIIDEVQRREA